MTDAECILKFLEGVRRDVITDLRDKDISKGDLGMEIPAVINTPLAKSGEIIADSYWYYLVHGRGPGKQPPMDNILAWLEKRGIVPDDISVKSLAYLIARKIGRLGTDIFLGIRPGLALNTIIESNRVELEKDLDAVYLNEIDEAIMKGLNSIFK